MEYAVDMWNLNPRNLEDRCIHCTPAAPRGADTIMTNAHGLAYVGRQFRGFVIEDCDFADGVAVVGREWCCRNREAGEAEAGEHCTSRDTPA